MKVSLREAAQMLGRSTRQVRYMIRTRRLPAVKAAGRWVVDTDELPLSDGQRRARERKAADLTAAVEEALGPHTKTAPRKTYSVREMTAFTGGLALLRAARALLGEQHAAVVEIEAALIAVTRGCHRYHRRDKATAFADARERASAAVARLYFEGSAVADAIGESVETDLLPVIAGLLRRHEGRRDR